jgi:orotidine-5'-phosphate decarboxylase
MTLHRAGRKKNARDYLIFALDVPSADDARRYIRMLGGRVGLFKVGLELFVRDGRRVIDDIREAGDTGIFLDLKLHDIPATVFRAMKNIAGMGVRLTTVHCAGQKDMLRAAADGAGGRVGVLGVTVLTSVTAEDVREAGFADPYTEDVSLLVARRAAVAAECGLDGVVCSPRELTVVRERQGRDFIAVTPGIRLSGGAVAGDDQRRVMTPAEAVTNGADYIVVGRPIRDAADPPEAADGICREIEAVL